jgi:hypothetical protein
MSVVACSDGAGPFVDYTLPAAASAGAEVDIHGKRFCGDDSDAADSEGVCATPPQGVVTVGGARATVVLWRHERIAVTVPGAAEVGPGYVVVTVNGVESNAEPFEVLP